MARQAASYRTGRVLPDGDAAHAHYPTDGRGLSTGVPDAVNLGWKLAQVVKRTSPESLLDTYHAERHPIAATVSRSATAQGVLLRTDERANALRDTVSELLGNDGPRRGFGAMMSDLDIRYGLGAGGANAGAEPSPSWPNHDFPCCRSHPAPDGRGAPLGRRAWR